MCLKHCGFLKTQILEDSVCRVKDSKKLAGGEEISAAGSQRMK
jgi:hypothetical protein